jgi:hypothetical protein
VKKLLIEVAIIIIFLFAVFIGGCRYGRTRVKCPEVTTDTILKYDTITYTIHDVVTHVVRDTIYYPDTIPADVDTAAILKDYFAIYSYDWSKPDSIIDFNLKTTITENRPVKYDFSYKLLRPQTIVNNVTTINNPYYNRIYLGATVPLKSAFPGIDVMMVTEKYYGGVEYQPKEGIFSIKGGISIIKFK